MLSRRFPDFIAVFITLLIQNKHVYRHFSSGATPTDEINSSINTNAPCPVFYVRLSNRYKFRQIGTDPSKRDSKYTCCTFISNDIFF